MLFKLFKFLLTLLYVIPVNVAIAYVQVQSPVQFPKHHIASECYDICNPDPNYCNNDLPSWACLKFLVKFINSFIVSAFASQQRQIV